uniref:Peptidase C1A papain C-terminal domain-containing protein n=1 Tax=Setaria digitata TaxID=48799 RepID=A0A915PGM5_9BILA
MEDDRPEPHRLLAYAKNIKEIEKHNGLYKLGKTTFRLGLNRMTDMADEDLEKYFPIIKVNRTNVKITKVSVERPPETVNWAINRYVTEVRDYFKFKNCLAAAAAASSVAGAIEAYAKKQGEKLTPLSAQELLDCTSSHCGTSADIFEYFSYILTNNGLLTEEDYPFVGRSSKCRAKPTGKRFGNPLLYLNLHNHLLSFKAALSKGPVVTRILTTAKFYKYEEAEVAISHLRTHKGYLRYQQVICEHDISHLRTHKGYLRYQQVICEHDISHLRTHKVGVSTNAHWLLRYDNILYYLTIV